MSEETPTPAESVSIYSHLTLIIDQMAMIAWTKLGLQPDYTSGKIEKNLEEARVAIDLVAFAAGQLESQCDEDDRKKLQGLVRDLRVNYVQKAKE